MRECAALGGEGGMEGVGGGMCGGFSRLGVGCGRGLVG